MFVVFEYVCGVYDIGNGNCCVVVIDSIVYGGIDWVVVRIEKIFLDVGVDELVFDFRVVENVINLVFKVFWFVIFLSILVSVYFGMGGMEFFVEVL